MSVPLALDTTSGIKLAVAAKFDRVIGLQFRTGWTPRDTRL
jgi:hypothetical protein